MNSITLFDAAEREAAARREQILAEAAKPAVTRALEMIEREKDGTPGKSVAPAPINVAPVADGIARAAATGDAADEAPTLTLGAINERLHPISVSAAGSRNMGAHRTRRACSGNHGRIPDGSRLASAGHGHI